MKYYLLQSQDQLSINDTWWSCLDDKFIKIAYQLKLNIVVIYLRKLLDRKHDSNIGINVFLVQKISRFT